jgi:putative flippase GtrA
MSSPDGELVQHPTGVGGVLGWLRARFSDLLREVAKFGVVGLVALVVDVGLFNLLRFAGGEGPLYDKPLTAKAISVTVATVVAYLGNRFWTFRNRARTGFAREYVLFFVLNGVGLAISVGVWWIRHSGLTLRPRWAASIPATVTGFGLGTLSRFWSYRRWVFPEVPDDELTAELRQPV